MAEEKIRILHMTPMDINNGVYRYIFNHMCYMDRQKYQFAFLTRGADKLKRTQEYQEYRFPIHMLHYTQRDGEEGLRKEIVNILEEGYDAIHLHTSSWRGFLIEQIAMKAGTGQVIVHSHSTGIDVVDDAERDKQIEEHRRYRSQFSMEYATDLCACSGLAADWLFGSGIPKNQIRILPNAIDVKKYHFQPSKRQMFRASLNLENRIVVGNMGRYSYQKNQMFLLRAFAKAHVRNKFLFLLCLGEGILLNDMKKLIQELNIEDSVLCMKWQEHAEDYLQAMDMFCLPSRFEGLPISVIEAQAAGVKCLVSDRVTEEVKITDLVTFLPLEEEYWVEEMTKCQIDVYRDRRDEEIAIAGYDIRIAAERLGKLYHKK